ncbi:MAG: SDR family NAD(P)-dependent oxidoreductase [Acidobacteriota bacterium]|jgi:NAD(P)-dependent dehydrogenase (short-subunit alcohol dehydrogenase family)|nr:SDR family NAD(P)-dependent oxidoreductase [Acidobacteriota bacterium]NLT32139.1 SDR family oxidoreductase [Acidobacteriota bacterium]
MDLKNKAAVVTGSSAGVGRAAALKFAERGCSVVINYNRSLTEAEDAAERCRALGAKAVVVQADVSVEADCRRLIQEAVDAFGRLDVLVNNAAVTRFVEFGDLEALSEDVWLEILRTNLMGNFFCTRAAVPHMKRAGEGAIVNVVSIAGFLGHGSSIAYSASKAAVINMTKCLARTLGPEIRVNGIAPGGIDTRWLRRGLGEEEFGRVVQSVRDTTPLEVLATPEEVADAILWLAEGASMMTGETIKFDGGQHLGGKSGLRRR